MTSRQRALPLVLIALVLLTVACDKVPLTAPSGSSVTLNAGTRALPAGGTTELSAFVLESAGTPVQNGTHVSFTTTLGTVTPATAQTRNGIATATFNAGTASGVAEIRATSGAAGSASSGGTGGTATSSNVITIGIGAAAVDTLAVRVVPSSVSGNGGTVEVIAVATGTGGRTLAGIPVTFTTDNGSLSSTTATTDASGEARTNLTTDRATVVTAAAGSKTATASVTVRTGPTLTFTCAVGATTNCAAVNVDQPVTFTIARGTTTSNIRSATLDFGDGDRIELGTLTSSTTVNHTYTSTGTYTARVTATDTAGEQAVSTQIVQVRSLATVTLSAENNAGTVTATADTSGCTPVSYTFTFTGGSPVTVATTSNSARSSYTGTASLRALSVEVRCADGRTATDSTTVSAP